jgi:hypothetical protein
MVAYYSPSGETVEFSGTTPAVPVATEFDATAVKDAIREAQTLVPGYTSRSAETHVEHFPQIK